MFTNFNTYYDPTNKFDPNAEEHILSASDELICNGIIKKFPDDTGKNKIYNIRKLQPATRSRAHTTHTLHNVSKLP
jgi:hypothetical protein